jgi:Fe2+ transport system protein FeoA
MDVVMIENLTCPVCGYQYESGPEGACGPCPLHSDCAMACCPACGHTTINTEKSAVVNLFRKLFKSGGKVEQAKTNQPLTVHVRQDQSDLASSINEPVLIKEDVKTLDDVIPGETIKIDGFATALSLQHQLRLQAFGVEPGQSLSIIQQHPVTIVKVGHTELAVEHYLAHQIYVN